MSIELRDFAAGKKFRYESFSEEKKEREKVMNGKLKSLRCGTDCRSDFTRKSHSELTFEELHFVRGPEPAERELRTISRKPSMIIDL